MTKLYILLNKTNNALTNILQSVNMPSMDSVPESQTYRGVFLTM